MISVVPILLAIALVVFFARNREHLADTPTMKPYDERVNGYGAEEDARIVGLVPELHAQMLTMFDRNARLTPDDKKRMANDFIILTVRRFHDEIYVPATSPITEDMIKEFVDKIGSPPGLESLPEKIVKLLKIYYGVGSTNEALPPGSTVQNTTGTMEELTAKYKAKLAEYERMVANAIESRDTTKIEKIRRLNTEVSDALNAMIEKLTYLRRETPSLKKYRDELIERLSQIQLDYNGLKANKDTLETLRRIRQQESGEANRQMYWYVIAFLVTSIAILVFLIFYGNSETTAMMASTVPTTPPLM